MKFIIRHEVIEKKKDVEALVMLFYHITSLSLSVDFEPFLSSCLESQTECMFVCCVVVLLIRTVPPPLL